MNEKDVREMSTSERAKQIQKIDSDRMKSAVRTKFYEELNTLVERLDERILMTPTSETRNLLTDCRIVISHIVNGKLLTK